jgi:hypothetical protein
MDTLKGIITGCLLLCVCCKSIAQSTVSTDPVSGEVVFKQSFILNANVADEDAYALVQDWITHGTENFTRQNTDIPSENGQSKNKLAVDKAFDNSRPLQSLDPFAKRIAVRGLIKYYGGPTTLISLLYIEYYMVAEVSEHRLTVTINKLKYHHFSAHTYAPRLIYHWEGGQPCAAADKFETLVEHQSHIPEMENVNAFLSSDIHKLLKKLRDQLKASEALDHDEITAALKAPSP